MKYLIPSLPLIIGAVADLIIGDPYNFPHPIKAVGKLISFMEKAVRKNFRDLRKGGIFLTIVVCFIPAAITALLLFICYRLSTILGVAAESIICCYMLAARCLCKESMKVCNAAEKNDTEAARQAVSMIVGRDTSVLDHEGIIRAAVETVAENTSDGVTAPIFYMALGGGVLGMLYKSVNTMDSMIGYKNDDYIDLGRTAAKLDDVLNFIPSRLTALLMAVVASPLGMDSRNALRIWKRDRLNHASPNSAQTESACAGALHLRLAGNAVYFGKVHKKPYIGDNDRPIEDSDIRRANRLMYGSSALMLLLAVIFRTILFGVIL